MNKARKPILIIMLFTEENSENKPFLRATKICISSMLNSSLVKKNTLHLFTCNLLSFGLVLFLITKISCVNIQNIRITLRIFLETRSDRFV